MREQLVQVIGPDLELRLCTLEDKIRRTTVTMIVNRDAIAGVRIMGSRQLTAAPACASRNCVTMCGRRARAKPHSAAMPNPGTTRSATAMR